ncbi:hypothetical protein N234_28805 [Ralstonia pickettii DTP0602]|nr:hypothetical protein N234_28805 [Ralstonia pickettii DTP0602]
MSDNGFEIGLHNVGDGACSRQAIAVGLGIFKETFGTHSKAWI